MAKLKQGGKLLGGVIVLFGAAAFAALVPVLVTLLGIPVLGEIPDIATLVAGACVCVGVFLASGILSPAR